MIEYRLRWIDIDAYEEAPKDDWGIRVDIDRITWMEYKLAKARYEEELENIKAAVGHHFTGAIDEI